MKLILNLYHPNGLSQSLEPKQSDGFKVYSIYIYIYIHIISYHIISYYMHTITYLYKQNHIISHPIWNSKPYLGLVHVFYISATIRALQTLLHRHWTCWWTTTRSSKGATNGAITTGDVQYIRFVYIHKYTIIFNKYTIIFNKYMSCVYIYTHICILIITYNQSVLHLLLFIWFYMCIYIYINGNNAWNNAFLGQLRGLKRQRGCEATVFCRFPQGAAPISPIGLW